MLEHKDFNQRKEIADILELNFLKKYFGENKRILDFAKILFLSGNKKVEKEFNKAVNLLGSKVDAELIIEKLIHLNVSINAHDCYNQTPLHIACQKGYNSIIQLLIEKKVLNNFLSITI